jgi:hypothetical protein
MSFVADGLDAVIEQCGDLLEIWGHRKEGDLVVND